MGGPQPDEFFAPNRYARLRELPTLDIDNKLLPRLSKGTVCDSRALIAFHRPLPTPPGFPKELVYE
jgi:hypothetical protein